MYAQVIPVDPAHIDPATIAHAAEILRHGDLVGLPTETVYGLAADALNPAAVKKIFAAKKRPADNPLICHVAEPEEIQNLTTEVSADAQKLMDAFWPGALTLIFKAQDHIPSITVAGTGRVAIRLPSHPVARAVITAAGTPLAAPSANLSGRPSPTQAQHVVDDIGEQIPLVLDAGPCTIGLESTVVDVSGERPVIARLGGISQDEIGEIIGLIEVRDSAVAGEKPISPGQKYRHYAPRTPLILVENLTKIKKELADATDKKVAIVATDDILEACTEGAEKIPLGAPDKPEQIAARLFAALREADELSIDLVIAHTFAPVGAAAAALQRLRKAVGK